jgi:hypothetical protein
MVRRKAGKPERPRGGVFHGPDGTVWQCAWYVSRNDPKHGPTHVYLRRESDGPGDHTHEATVEIESAMFDPELLELPFHPKRPGFTMRFN